MVHLSHLVNDSEKVDICIVCEELFKICMISDVIDILILINLLRVTLLFEAFVRNITNKFLMLQKAQIYARTNFNGYLIFLE